MPKPLALFRVRWGLASWLTLGMTLLIVFLMGSLTFLDMQRERSIFRDSLEQRGRLLADTLHDVLADSLYYTDLDKLRDTAKTVRSQPDINYFRIFGPNGKILVQVSDEMDIQSKYATGSVRDEFALSVLQSAQTKLRFRGNSLEVAAPIKVGPQLLGAVQFGFTDDSLSDEISTIIQQHVWQGVILVTVGMILSYLIARIATKPLSNLTAAAQSIGRGNLGIPVISGGTKETVELGAALEYMRGELHKHYGALEQEVATRTEDLSRTNEQLKSEVIQRSQTEVALRETQEHLRTVIETTSVFLFALDPEGVFTIAEGKALDSEGNTLNELVGRSIFDVYCGVPVILENIRWALAGETRSVNLDVGDLTFEARYEAMRDQNDQVVGVVGLVQEITERKEAEWALQDSNRRLEEALAELCRTQQGIIQQERLRALGQMASGIAHEFNNALMPIAGFSELLLTQPQYLRDKKKLTEYLRGINTAAQDAVAVVSRLREFYNQREGETDHLPVKLNDFVVQAISLTQPKWKDEAEASSIAISIETDLQEVPPILGNEGELRQVLINMILNAVHAMPNGGTITIRTRLDGQDAVVEVSDTGVGMSEDTRQRCFEPFFTTKGEGGTGMGLAMVYGTIQRHEGTIDVESERDKGTTFFIRLPARKARKAKTKKKAPAPTAPLRVLLVDDEPSVLQVLNAFLTRDGHNVETATNGREGLEKLLAGTLDLVVTDRAMPGMSGDQLAAAIKTIRPTPVILLTGFGDIMHVNGEKPAGVDLIVSKPVSGAALRQAVAKVISKQIPRRSKVVGDTTTRRTTPTPEIRSHRRSP